MSVLLVTLQWSVGSHCPTPWEVAVGIWATNVADFGNLFFNGLRDEVERTHCIDETPRATFLACSVVAHHHDDGVVKLT